MGWFERKTSRRQFPSDHVNGPRFVKFLRQRFRWQINSSLPPLLEEGSLTNNTVKKEERKENYSLVSPCEKKRKKREEGNVHALPYACVRSL